MLMIHLGNGIVPKLPTLNLQASVGETEIRHSVEE